MHHGGAAGSAVSTTVETITFVNTSGSTSPGPTPIQTGVWFAPGAVPAGQIAVPQIGGSDLATWQADDVVYWGDGSLRGYACSGLVASGIAGSGSQQITWVSRTGSFSNTSSVTTSTITGETDYNLRLSNLHSAQLFPVNTSTPGYSTSIFLGGLTMAAGAITGGVVYNNRSGATNGTYAVQGGHGTGGNVTITGTTVSVNSGGSGYAPEGTNGTFQAYFNNIVSVVNGSGNYNGARLEQYAKGPCKDAWRGMIQIVDSTGGAKLPHYYAVFWIERWKDGAGNLLAYKASAQVSSQMLDFTTSPTLYTHDCDWRNGSTVIRGAALGSAGFNTIALVVPQSYKTFDSSGRPDWSANDAAYKAVLQQRTATEAAALQATGLILPQLNITPSFTAPTTPSAFGSGDVTDSIPLVQPGAYAGLRIPYGSGGAGNDEQIYSLEGLLYLMQLKLGNTSAAQTWYKVARGAAANTGYLGYTQPTVDPTTFFGPNVLPDSVTGGQPFHGVIASYSNKDQTNFPLLTSYAQGSFPNRFGYTSNYHMACHENLTYLIEAEQWMLDQMMWTSIALPFWNREVGDLFEKITFNSNTYYPPIACGYDVRRPAWSWRVFMFAAAFSPVTYSGGGTNYELSYLSAYWANEMNFLIAYYPWASNVTYGNGAVESKHYDWTASGIFQMRLWIGASVPLNETTGQEEDVFFMSMYLMTVLAMTAYVLKGTSLGTNLATVRDYLKNYVVGLFATPGSHYFSASYTKNMLNGPGALSAPVSNWVFDPSSPTVGIRPLSGNTSNFADLSFINGSATIQAVLNDTTTPTVLTFQFNGGGTPSSFMADGTAVMLTTTQAYAEIPNNYTIPSGFSAGVWYYLKNINAAAGTFQLYSDQALTVGPLVPGSTHPTGTWMVPANTLPADNSGAGNYGIGGLSKTGTTYQAQACGTMRMCKAFGMDNTGVSIDNAIASASAICAALGEDFTTNPIYGQADSLS